MVTLFLYSNTLKVHLINNSHDDVGWEKTPEEYYYGHDMKSRVSSVRYMLEGLIGALTIDKNRKFSQAEIFYLKKYWKEASP